MSTLIQQGSYGIESPRDDIEQVEYGCTDCESENQGFMEILYVKSPPPGRKPYLIHYRMYFQGRYARDKKPCIVRLEICCETFPIAKRIWKELGKIWMNLDRLCIKISILGHDVRFLQGEELPWMYEPQPAA